MAMIGGINIHRCKRITASASATEGATGLNLQFGDRFHEYVMIFMPLDRAQRIADAINSAEDPVVIQEAAE